MMSLIIIKQGGDCLENKGSGHQFFFSESDELFQPFFKKVPLTCRHVYSCIRKQGESGCRLVSRRL